MIRFLSIAAALATSAALLGASAGYAQTANGYYVATPVVTSAKNTLVTRSTPWRQTGGAFVAARAPERDMVLCQLVAKDLGQLSGFSVGGAAYDATSLEKCNSKADVAKVTIAKTDTSGNSSN